MRSATRSAPPDTRVLAALCLSSFLAALNFYAMTPFYAAIARDLHTTVPLLGQIATLMILISAALGLVIGPLSDRYGVRRPLVVGVLAVAVTLVGSGLATSYPLLLLVSVSGGLADAFVFGLPLAIAGMHFTGADQRRAMAWILGSLSTAPIIGVPVMTTIGGLTSWRIALVAAGIAASACAWFVSASLPATSPRAAARLRWRDLLAAYRPLIHHPPTLRIFGASLFRAVATFGILTYLGAYLADELGLSTQPIGLVYTAGGIGSALGGVLSSRLHVGSPRTMVGVTCIVSGGAAGLLVVSGSAWIAVPLLVLISLSNAFTAIAIVTLLATESRAGTGTTMVLNGSVLNLGAAGGAAIGGGLLAIGDYTLLGLVLPVFALAAAALAWWPHDPVAVSG